MKHPYAFRTLHCILVFCAVASLAVATAQAQAQAEAEADSHGLSAQQTHELITAGETPVLFLDVRDPVEIQFTGFTDAVDVNIPFLLADRSRLNAERSTFLMERNPHFSAQVAEALAAKGLDRDSLIITICRSGSDRGEPSAAFLRQQGFPNAKYVVHGFQGDVIAEGEHAGFRLQNGWQNDGLPWSPRFNSDKIFVSSAPSESRTLLIVLTSSEIETQTMALVLARATLQRGRPVRLLLCDTAGVLALKNQPASGQPVVALAPVGLTPAEMLGAIIEMGAEVEVCALFAPNRGLTMTDFRPGIGSANPAAISVLLTDPGTQVLSF